MAVAFLCTVILPDSSSLRNFFSFSLFPFFSPSPFPFPQLAFSNKAINNKAGDKAGNKTPVPFQCFSGH